MFVFFFWRKVAGLLWRGREVCPSNQVIRAFRDHLEHVIDIIAWCRTHVDKGTTGKRLAGEWLGIASRENLCGQWLHSHDGTAKMLSLE